MNNQNLFLKTKPSRLFLRAALPGGISMLVSCLYMVFDSIFVGKYVGTTAFAALGLAIPLVIVNFAISDMIAVGSAVPISIFLGRKEDKKANNYFTCACIMIFVSGLAMGALMYFASPTFMKLMGAEGQLADFGVKYIRIYALFSPITTINYAIDNFLRISGKIKTSMWFNIIMSLGTVVLELIFVVFLKMGIGGAALGANIAIAGVALWATCMFASGKLQLKFTKPAFNTRLFVQIFKNGFPAFLTNVAGRVFSVIMNVLLLKTGGESAVAIYGVLMTCAAVVEQVLYGVLDSLQPALGYNFGAGMVDRVKTLEKYCLGTTAMISIFFAVLIFAIPGYLAIPFLEDLSLLEVAKHALKILSFTFVFKWISFSFQFYFMALEKPFPAMCISTTAVFVFPLVLIPVLMPLGLDGLWLNYTVTSVLSAIFAVVLILVYKNKLFENIK